MKNENTEELLNIMNNTIDKLQEDIQKLKCVLNEHNEKLNDLNRIIVKIEGKNDFQKIVLSDFGSRLTILEEEGEKYNKN